LPPRKCPSGEIRHPRCRRQFEAAINATCDTLLLYHQDDVANGNLTDAQIKIGMLLGDEKLTWYLIAISLGAVFFGAMTYIGNGPNFMVKSIAESAGARCPSFLGYILCYALPILLPVLIVVWAVFLRPHAGRRRRPGSAYSQTDTFAHTFAGA